MEEDFRIKLGQREIMPSEGAWDRLDAMLSVAEGKKKRDFRWLYIAASILGFALIATWFFGSTQEMTDTARPRVVVNETEETQVTPSTPEAALPMPTTATSPAAVAIQTPKVGRHAEATSEKGAIVNAPVTYPTNEAGTNGAGVAQNTNEIIHQKTGQVAPKPVTVDAAALLASVDNKGKVTVPFSGKEKVKVDAASLLSQVDGELDMTFREKTIRTVTRNYQNVKVALSNRNNE